MYDVIVIGGGASGLMASIAAAQQGVRVALFEKNANLGKKLLLTGGGRCNVTNNKTIDEIIAHIPGNGRFLYSCLHQFNSLDIIQFFEERKVALKEEDHGRMFPKSNEASSIVNTLIKECKQLKVDIFLQHTVEDIVVDQNAIKRIIVNKKAYEAKTYIVCTGGKSFPKTGSTGDGYRFAKKLGHTIQPLYASESPLIACEKLVSLQGVSLQDASLSVKNPKGKVVVTHQMDVLFTHQGLSGPAALRCASFVNEILLKHQVQQVEIQLDVVAHLSKASMQAQLEKAVQVSKEKEIKTILKAYCVERYILYILKRLGIDEHKKMKDMHRDDFEKIIEMLKSASFHIKATLPIEQSFVSAGGISTKEINPKTMESKVLPGLYFAGELIDVHGYTGGYNITYAFSSGFVSGTHAANKAKEKYLD